LVAGEEISTFWSLSLPISISHTHQVCLGAVFHKKRVRGTIGGGIREEKGTTPEVEWPEKVTGAQGLLPSFDFSLIHTLCVCASTDL
jgi:hypothetical protein